MLYLDDNQDDQDVEAEITEKDINKVAAKALKAKLMGDTEKEAKLNQKVERSAFFSVFYTQSCRNPIN